MLNVRLLVQFAFESFSCANFIVREFDSIASCHLKYKFGMHLIFNLCVCVEFEIFNLFGEGLEILE